MAVDQRLSSVSSGDGTHIAYWTSGEGPPLVLVHGAGSVHTTFNAVVPHLEGHFTVHAMDRRGRGESGDGPSWALEREFEDVAAVVDAIATDSGQPVDLLGHSLGGLCAYRASLLTTHVRRLVLYEGWPVADVRTVAAQPGAVERIAARLAEGNRDGAYESFLREVVEMSSDEISGLRSIPGWWQERVALAHTLPRELGALDGWRLERDEASRLQVPTLLLVGTESPEHIKADYETFTAALPRAQVVVLEGQAHIAHLSAPELFARHVLAFLRQ